MSETRLLLPIRHRKAVTSREKKRLQNPVHDVRDIEVRIPSFFYEQKDTYFVGPYEFDRGQNLDQMRVFIQEE